ncbi:hypothetical protein BAUCODRAFT_497545 [Baudoinia panamericana UAMH 10762]|uniref:Secreted protein n=1 Tax=Baudoinia panamericana (strain UAMH 10762) TaxID=717646 RepID=M2N9X0_BAUPA|nr:uncharacterized protein BAUCODRAFT_497545 [Baudoinia panamericana UAMH 10762]EMC95635.1 hypothetical protein BAUCODRAFT_497545 [Baudoinia panamericana UAMH 10762]
MRNMLIDVTVALLISMVHLRIPTCIANCLLDSCVNQTNTTRHAKTQSPPSRRLSVAPFCSLDANTYLSTSEKA